MSYNFSFSREIKQISKRLKSPDFMTTGGEEATETTNRSVFPCNQAMSDKEKVLN